MNIGKRTADGNILDENSRDLLKRGKYDDPAVQLYNRYDDDAEGPLMVIVKDKREEFNLGNIHPIIGKKF